MLSQIGRNELATNYVSTLSTLFIFASDRDYCLRNPAEKIPKAILDDGAPGILTVEQVAELLNVTREEDPGVLAYVAIGLFAGLRRSELCPLEWSEIDLEARTIEVKGGASQNPSAPHSNDFRYLGRMACIGTEVVASRTESERRRLQRAAQESFF